MSELTAEPAPTLERFVPALLSCRSFPTQGPAGHVTLEWLMSSLQKHRLASSCLCGRCSAAPGVL